MRRRFVRRGRRPVRRTRSTFKRRRSTFRRRRSSGLKYDGGYNAKAETRGTLTTDASGTIVLSFGWNTNGPLAGSIIQPTACPEFAAFASRFRQYRLVGFAVELNLVGHQVATSLSSTTGFNLGGIIQILKASFIGATAIPTAFADMQKQYDYKDFNVAKGKIKFYIGLKKFWKSKLGQVWLQTNLGVGFEPYSIGLAAQDAWTSIMIQTQNWATKDIGTYVVRPYFQFRGVAV